jgi:hypothetical protein
MRERSDHLDRGSITTQREHRIVTRRFTSCDLSPMTRRLGLDHQESDSSLNERALRSGTHARTPPRRRIHYQQNFRESHWQ